MGYQVLARKWRPRNFTEMVGQEPTLRMLMNALDHQRLHHAYLFTGTRGVGKTTLARILAKCLNCESGITSKPCGECSICQSIDTGKFLDLIEIDAASRTKVEDTREVLDNVQYSPTQGRYKIYLIDEVHMLSGHSFNALLKTLEEPPSHVKFLLATTDPKRLPVTILSRCLQFNLKRVPLEQITQHLKFICESENIPFESLALELVAKGADGSLRDALSLLDQTIAYCGENITTADTRLMLGSIENDAIFRLLNAIADNDGMKLLNEIAMLAEQAPDFNFVLEEIISILHQVSVTHIIPESNYEEQVKTLAQKLSVEDVQLYYQIALIGRRDLTLSPHPQQGFEMIMLRMLAFKPMLNEMIDINSALTNTQSHSSITTQMDHSTTNNSSTHVKTNLDSSTRKSQNKISDTHQTNITNFDWSDILSKLSLTGLTYAIASNCTLASIENDIIKLSHSPQHAVMLNPKITERINDALNQYFNKKYKLEIKNASEEIVTPAKQKQQEILNKHQAATQAINNDTQVKKIIEMFDATLDVDSIKAID